MDQPKPFVRFSTLNLVQTCQRLAYVYGVKNLQLKREKKTATALSTGVYMHRLLAMANIAKLSFTHPNHARVTALRVFKFLGEDVCQHMKNALFPAFHTNPITDELILTRVKLYVNWAAGYMKYEEQTKARAPTISGMINAVLNYCENEYKFLNTRIWVEKDDDPNCLVGIELTLQRDIEPIMVTPDGALDYQGTLDALVIDKFGNLVVIDYKTTATISPVFEAMYKLSPQFTGYMWLSGAGYAEVHGITTTVSKTGVSNYTFEIEMTDARLEHWRVWTMNQLFHLNKLQNASGSNRIIPNYQSCAKWFRNCSLLSYCEMSHEDFDDALLHDFEIKVEEEEEDG